MLSLAACPPENVTWVAGAAATPVRSHASESNMTRMAPPDGIVAVVVNVKVQSVPGAAPATSSYGATTRVESGGCCVAVRNT